MEQERKGEEEIVEAETAKQTRKKVEGSGRGSDHIGEKVEERTVVKPRNTQRTNSEKPKVLIKFEIEKRDENDVIKMCRIIGRAANLKKETTHFIAKYLLLQCLAEYRANNMLG